ncbi:MAG TPA: CPBP family intramembrane glutamic endopeptidase [Pseudomonadales bacterium]|nr:CPBP family intramembrane glutamic endopeptidase [Pseudomonadales bacterium]
MREPEDPARALLPWSLGRVLTHALVVAAVFLLVSLVLDVATSAVLMVADPAFDPQQPVVRVAPLGTRVWVASMGTALACVPLVLFLVSRCERAPLRFVFGAPTTWRTLAVCGLVLLVFALASDLLTILIDRPLVPPIIAEVHASAHPLPLFLALVVAAPLFEEVFFRGLVLGGLVSSGLSARAAAVASALAWSTLHLQYDLYGVATIFAMGLLLAWARLRTRSLLPCLLMHGLANLYAFVQLVWIAGRAGA